MPSNSPEPTRSPRAGQSRPVLAAGALAGLAGLLAVFGRAETEIALLTARPQLSVLENGAVADDRTLQRLHSELRALADSSGTPAAYEMASRVSILQALAARSAPALRAAPLVTAREELVQQLRREPADHRAWLRLTHVASAQGDWTGAVTAWLRVTKVAAFEPVSMPARIEGGIALWPYMTVQARDALLNQARGLWRHRPEWLYAALDRRAASPAVADLLDRLPEIRPDYEKHRAKVGPRGA